MPPATRPIMSGTLVVELVDAAVGLVVAVPPVDAGVDGVVVPPADAPPAIWLTAWVHATELDRVTLFAICP